jgi:adenosylcobalamin-dependent ribonucleoside-triphosphate reductase
MYERIFTHKFTPPGRGLWVMGTALTETRKVYAGLFNCAFVSTNDLKRELADPFCFLMDMSMLGVGVGFDTLGGLPLKKKKSKTTTPYIIADSREGWVHSLRLLLMHHFIGSPKPIFNYSLIRLKGTPISTFGGKASGPEPLMELHEYVDKALTDAKVVDYRTITDIMNMIGVCVVAGNVRRTAEIAFGKGLDFANLKNLPERGAFGWSSNNSISADLGQDYKMYEEFTRKKGEPGYIWLENMRRFSRMGHPPDNKDLRVAGSNPCVEQSLESYELCCLVESYLNRHSDQKDFLRTLKYAYLYSKTVTLTATHWPQSNRVMLRNRRIGCSLSGVQQFIKKESLSTLRSWLLNGYEEVSRRDKQYSDWLVCRESIKKTSIKPSGTVSLLAGATSGMHWPTANYHIRRVIFDKDSVYVPLLVEAGYKVERRQTSFEPTYDDKSVCVEFPVEPEIEVPDVSQISMWEQLEMAAFLQENWADNQVSCTVTFDQEKEGGDIAAALNHFQYRLKGISFLPTLKIPLNTEENVKLVRAKEQYPQMPYSPITKEEYTDMVKNIKSIAWRNLKAETTSGSDKFCDGASCTIQGNGDKIEKQT